jgi:outer membrane protein OmpA-like peptidoglycan-associated protein
LGKGEKIVLRRIYFHPNTYAFREESRPSIQALYRYMEERPEARIEIQGHTASDRSIEETNPLYRDKGAAWNFTGTAEELSLLRAKAVKKELLSKGIEEDRLKAKGFGASEKLIENPETPSEEQKNMRVEVRILK